MQELSFTTELQPQVEITVNKLVSSKNVFRRCGHFYTRHTPGQIPPPLVGEPRVEDTLFPQAVFLWALANKNTNTIQLFWCVLFLVLCNKQSCQAPAGQWGSSSLGTLVIRWKSSWQALQKCVVPKQKKTATEQQYRHLYSRKSVPCLEHIC